MTLGAVLILSALLLCLYNRHEADAAGQEAESLLVALESWMQENSTDETESAQTIEMPVARLHGYDCVGYVEIPALGTKLPVLSDWDYDRLKLAPCRQHGSSRTDDLVIAAHNYRTHFGRLKALSPGDTVIVTDLDGTVHTYRIASIDTMDPYDVDPVLNSGYALVLYTCTRGGSARLVVYCDRIDPGQGVAG